MSSSGHEIEIIGPDGIPIGAFRRRPPPPRRIGLHVLLFLLTLATTTILGALQFVRFQPGSEPTTLEALLLDPRFLAAGLSFSIPLFVILLAHEFGHYFACRYHRLDATLPYFIPVPVGIGTFGAFIKIRSAIHDKRELLDVGAAGPLSGFLVTIPVLALGLAQSHWVPVEQLSGAVDRLGEPLLMHLMASLIHPDVPPGGDVVLGPVAFAAWIGLFVTALNLLPLAQLDGGHILYAALGRWQRIAAWPVLMVMAVLGYLAWVGWWLWVILAMVMGPHHPRLADEGQRLDWWRIAIGVACLAVMVLSFTPEPFEMSLRRLIELYQGAGEPRVGS